MTVTLNLPYPPTVNHYWRHTRGNTFIGEKGRAYRFAVVNACVAARAPWVAGKVCVEVDVYPPDKRRRDLDNVLKALLDSIVHAQVIRDDSLIDRLVVTRKPDNEARVQVRITPYAMEAT
ncbi:MAG: RusA family crossover junction endodeoxyribonuclease [Betaproteobacteria bacterium]|nr:RusA family crossover junction endodeoxyribonuclease [Betaproteobacteria bacterium]